MPGRRVEGAALLVAGHGAPGVGAFDASAVHTLGQIGEALLATGTPFHIRRLTASMGDRYAADRKTIKRSLTELVNDPVRIAVVVLLGEIIELGEELYLATGAEAREYPEDATLPLAWIRERLANAKAEHLVIAVSARGAGDPARWLGALGTQRDGHVVAVDAPDDGNPMIDALLAGLCGDALDPHTGTVTMVSLSKHLADHAKAVQVSTIEDTVAQPPPLAGLWDVRHSQLAHRPRRRRAPGDPEDLTGTVLPGRFRIDRLVARGTFGTVYRARQLAVERDVAIKVLHADIDPSSDDGRLFVHEIRAAGRIDHSNVVRIYQADITHHGRLFFAMEMLDGSDLQELGADKLPKQRAVELVRQLLAGLGAAHDAGLVHADIKPANAIVIPPRAVEPGDSAPAPHERAVLVDFGLARLRTADRPAQSAGGTPMYMAPEQMFAGRVDARSDLFSIALVLVWLITGWRRPNAATMGPPDDLLDDPHLRQVLNRALDNDPAKRFQTARELSAALAGGPAQSTPAIEPATPIRPFRHLASFTENDRGRLHGREADITVITEHALYRRCVVYAAPSGSGKTSVLCAGLLPRLEALGIHAVYVRCRVDFAATVINKIAPGAASIADAITQFHEHRGGKLVIVVDQLEAAVGDAELVSSLLAYDRWPRAADVSIVLAVREDYLARLLARTQEIEPNLPIVRLPPLSPEGARAAIVTPLTEARLAIESALLDVLLSDLERAAAAIGPEMGWGDTPAVFPPHLQLACSVIHEAMAPGEATMTLAHYRGLGGFEAIVGEHLERVIERELDDGRDMIAKDLFLALVTSANQRAIRHEAELLAIVGAKHGGADRVKSVIDVLHGRGLLVPVHKDNTQAWELVHDSLVKRVLAWVDRKDLARRRAIELVRHHLRRSTKDAPSLLGRKDLRELADHDGAIEELEQEWSKRDASDVGWTPSRLVARSRQLHVRTAATFSSIVVAALLVGGIGFYRSRVEVGRSAEQQRLKALDLGRFTLALEMFDWDPVALRVQPTAATGLRWTMHAPDPSDAESPGPAFEGTWLVRDTPHEEGLQVVETIEAHGGRAFLVIARTGCSSSIVPLNVPGYTQREADHRIELRIPTCEVTRASTIEIPAGPYIFGGIGQPPAPIIRDHPESTPKARRVDVPAFAIDRTEVTNAEFGAFSAMARWTGIRSPSYPTSTGFRTVHLPRGPVVGVTWQAARAFCRFMGKQLPTSTQWGKAMRGGEQIDGKPNPVPDRNLPWGLPLEPIEASLYMKEREGPGAVGSFPRDRSPYGVLDLAGSATEWTDSIVDPDHPRQGFRIVRGANWTESRPEDAVDFGALENTRDEQQIHYGLGVRCALLP